MNKARYRSHDILIKLAALLGSGFAFIWGVHEYNENSDREFKKPYLEQQMQTCREISEIVARVARIENNSERAKNLDELSILYFGRGSLFLDGEALSEFRRFIDLVAGCEEKQELNECHFMNMGGYQINVAKACRNELIKSWGREATELLEAIEEPKIW